MTDKHQYEFLNNGDVFADGPESVDDYTSTELLLYVGRIDSAGDFRPADNFIGADENEMRRQLRRIIFNARTEGYECWGPSQELLRFAGMEMNLQRYPTT